MLVSLTFIVTMTSVSMATIDLDRNDDVCVQKCQEFEEMTTQCLSDNACQSKSTSEEMNACIQQCLDISTPCTNACSDAYDLCTVECPVPNDTPDRNCFHTCMNIYFQSPPLPTFPSPEGPTQEFQTTPPPTFPSPEEPIQEVQTTPPPISPKPEGPTQEEIDRLLTLLQLLLLQMQDFDD